MKLWTQALIVLLSSVTSASALAQSQLCYSLERSFSIARGDVILTTSKEGLIKDLMSAIGQYYTHTGIALSGSRVRHNTMDDDMVEQIATKGLRQLPDKLKATGDRSLRDGSPGMLSESLDGFKASTSLVLTGPQALQSARRDVAKAMEGLDGYYRLFAYTDMSWSNPTKRAADRGNMCSGSIAWASIRAGELPASARVKYSAEVRNGAAKVLYSSVEKRVRKAVPDWIKLVIREKRLSRMSANIANQVVNCMAFNDCGNTGDRWRKGVGEGNTLSPDNLLDLLHATWFVAALSGVENSYPYQWTAPVDVQSPLYCCRTDATSFSCN